MLGRRVVPEVHRLTNRHNKIPHESGREVCLPLSRAKGGEVRKEDASWWRGWSRMIDGAFPPEYHSAIDQGPNHFWCCGGHGGRPDPSLHCGRPKDARGLRLLPDRLRRGARIPEEDGKKACGRSRSHSLLSFPLRRTDLFHDRPRTAFRNSFAA